MPDPVPSLSAGEQVRDLERRVSRLERLLLDADRKKDRRCRVCNGMGAISGFWVGSVKTCPACHGKGFSDRGVS